MEIGLKNSRFAVLTAFFINGALMATWVSRIPTIQTKLSLNEGALGFVLLGSSVGVMVSLSMAGGLVARFGSAKVVLTGGIALCLTMLPLGLANHPVMLWISLFVFGAAISVMDVAMNDQAVQVERKTKRPLMSSFHATYSIGGLFGALLGAAMAGTAIFTPFLHFLIVGGMMAGLAIFAARFFIPTVQETSEKAPAFQFPDRALWMLGAVAFCAAIGEGSMGDWSAVYLTKVLGTSASYAALGFAGFSLTMTVGRFFGDALIARWSSTVVVRVGGIISTLGFITIILTNSPILAIVGFSLVGLGVANIIPIAFSVAGNFPGISSSAGIAGVATIGYAGFLAGPPVIGLIAEGTSLRIAFILVTLLVGSLIFTANAASPSN